MQGRIELTGSVYEVVVHGRHPDLQVQIDGGPPRPAVLENLGSGEYDVKIGRLQARAWMQFRGETAYLRVFGRTFTLRVVNPVEQARMATVGSSRRAKAPMPGVVVDIQVAEGQAVVKGQSMMTIESMKILTAIPAPGDGTVEKIHFAAGQSFEKGAVLATLRAEGR